MLRAFVEQLVWSALSCGALVMGKAGGWGRRKNTVLILPPADAGSLGDEAMLTATVEHLTSQRMSRIGLLSYGPVPTWAFIGRGKGETQIDYLHLDGVWNKVRLIWSAAFYETFYLLGADVLDGHYSEKRTIYRLRLTGLADRAGARAAIVGFSFNETPSAGSVRAFQGLPKGIRLCARDPDSQKRLERAARRQVELTADLAFLLEPDHGSQTLRSARQWIDGMRQQGSLLIGINANGLFSRKKGLTDSYIQAVSMQFEQNRDTAFVFIAHDRRKGHTEESDMDIIQRIFSSLTDEVRARSLVVPESSTSREIKAICSFLDVVLSGRMHLAIACLGQGTPVAALSYQGKLDGLFGMFGLSGVSLRVEDIEAPRDLYGLIRRLVDQRESLRAEIREKLPFVRERALRNFFGSPDKL